ncbi:MULTISPECIES: hypothetical protein [unclassified Pseudomonas]|uniref:hypothetical protein n=1 Tax=unclassified Pseudomonas TaxID=196821 RepID=UPI0011A3F29D|nr:MULTISPECIES: hypothetical protein [unclassified Pseudomonas]
MENPSAYTNYLTPATVIIGWIIVNWQNNKREERKELRSALSEIVESIELLEDAASRYHQADERNSIMEKEINLKITRLSAKIRYLRFESQLLNNAFIELKKSITLDNFETSHFSKQEPNAEIIESIYYSADSLRDRLEEEFSTLYRGPLRYRISASIRNFLSSCRQK